MLSKIFQGKVTLQCPNLHEDLPQLWIKDAKCSLVMWIKEDMKLT
jgi:hypothetical protein